MKCVLLNIKNVTRDKNHYISRVGINIFSFSLRFAVFSRFQSSDFPIECHVTDILRPGPGVNIRRRAEDHETGTRGQYQERRHWTLEEALLRLCRVIITRQCVSLSPVPAITQHADCRLTAWTCVYTAKFVCMFSESLK